MARAIIRHDDLAGQRAWLDAIRAETYTGMPRRLPRITRPKPPAQAPQPLLFACLPELPRPPKSVELPRAVARPAEPVPDDFTPEELFHIESFFARSSLDAAAVRRWDAWIADGRAATREIRRLPDLDGLIDISTIETRLGWGARVHFGNRRDHVARGNPIRPDYSGGVDWFFWQTRDAAIAYCANKIWASALNTRGYGDRKRRQWELFAGEMQAFCARVGIDVTAPPPASMKRVVIADDRVRELKAGAPPAPAPPAAALTPEEITEVEAYAIHGDTYGPVGDAARDRWNDWISEGAIGETFSVPLKGKRDRAVVEVVQTRLGWMLRCHYEYPDSGGGFGSGLLPLRDTVGRYFWADREAALQAGAHSAWSSAVHPTPGQMAEARARIGEKIRGYFLALGIDATVEPSRDRRRRLITKARIEELQAAAEAQAPAAAKPEDAEVQPQPPRIETDRKRTLAQVVAGAGMLSMRKPTLPDCTEIHAAIGEALPPGVPTYVRDILAVNRAPGQKGGRIIADVIMFDGETARIEIGGQPGARRYQWHSIGPEGSACYWDGQARQWRRTAPA